MSISALSEFVTDLDEVLYFQNLVKYKLKTIPLLLLQNKSILFFTIFIKNTYVYIINVRASRIYRNNFYSMDEHFPKDW